MIWTPTKYRPPSGTASTHLLHFDGTNGSTSFTDNGVDAVAVTAGGTGAISTGTVKFGTGSLNCGSAAGWAYLANSADQEFGTSDFTIDGWAYLVAASGQCCIFSKMLNAATVGAFHVKVDNTQTIYAFLSSQTGSWDYTINGGAGGFSISSFHHVALIRHGTALNLYVDGTSVANTTLSGSSYSLYANAAVPVSVGAAAQGGGEVWNGFIDEFAMTNVARWTANFTPPTNPYTS